MDIELKTDMLIKAKGFEISIGRRIDQVAIISKSTNEFTPLSSVKKSKRLSKIKRIFRNKLCDSTCFFFEGMDNDSTQKLIKLLK
jgi:hypothetical protein